MNLSFKRIERIGLAASVLAASVLYAAAALGAEGQPAGAEPAADKSLTQQIFDTMVQAGLYKPDLDWKSTYSLDFVNKKYGMEMKPK